MSAALSDLSATFAPFTAESWMVFRVTLFSARAAA